jgi:hypothetical protein
MASNPKKKNPRTDADKVPLDTDGYQQTEDRVAELLDGAGGGDLEDAAQELLQDVTKGFTDQWDRANQIMDNWDLYNCNLGPRQFYSGNSKIFVPIIHDCIEARKTRFTNQMFPVSGKHVEVIGSEPKPQDLQSLLEFYIRKAKLRTRVMPSLMRNGDVEGQYTVMLHWKQNKRHVVQRIKQKDKLDGADVDGSDEYDDIEEETILHQYPTVEVIADSDFLVLPQTADSIDEAIESGGSVTVIRRWSKYKIKQMIEDGEITKERGKSLIESMQQKDTQQTPNKKSIMVEASGQRSSDKTGKVALVYVTWTKLKIGDERRLVRIYYGSSGDDQVVSMKLNPFWNDKVPVLSTAVNKVEGSFKGIPPVKFVETMQYAANDAINEGMDSAAYALLPIVMTDPDKNPRSATMVLNVAAVWEVDPKSTQFAQFPQLWKEAFAIVASAKEQIFQTLGINPAMMPQQAAAPGKKMNQAQIANEQMVDILTTADAVTTLEEEILSPMMQWFVSLDHQFRNEDMTIRAFGEMGLRAVMQKIEPVQMDRRFELRWYGVEAARNAQQMQLQMAGINAIRSIPPQLYPGYELTLAPVIAQFVENLFGPRLSAEVFQDIRKRLTLEVEFENRLLSEGFDLPVQPMDNDQEHMQAHMQLMQQEGDQTGVIRAHIQRHQLNMQKKTMAAAMQQQQAMMQQQQQPPGRQQRGQPRAGGMASGPRPAMQGPPGMVPRDQLQGPGGPRQRVA